MNLVYHYQEDYGPPLHDIYFYLLQKGSRFSKGQRRDWKGRPNPWGDTGCRGCGDLRENDPVHKIPAIPIILKLGTIRSRVETVCPPRVIKVKTELPRLHSRLPLCVVSSYVTRPRPDTHDVRRPVYDSHTCRGTSVRRLQDLWVSIRPSSYRRHFHHRRLLHHRHQCRDPLYFPRCTRSWLWTVPPVVLRGRDLGRRIHRSEDELGSCP